MPGSAVDQPVYNIAAVVHRTRVPAPTIRAWERRYGFPVPERASGGRRLYSERDVQAISWLRDQTARGVTISQAMHLVRERSVAAAGSSFAAATASELRDQLLAYLLRFDGIGADATFRSALALLGLEDTCLQVLEPALVAIGDGWCDGEVSVAEEHFASAFIRTRLSALVGLFPPGGGPTIFTACAPGEQHDIGLLMVRLLLARQRYDVRNLGPNLPVAELRGPVDRLAPALVIVSAHGPETAAGVGEAADLLASLPQPRPLLGYGGRAFNQGPDLRTCVPGTYLGPTALDAVHAVRELIGPPHP